MDWPKDAGLLRLDPRSGILKQWRHNAANAQSISHDRIYALLEDRAGQLWIGTEAGAHLMPERESMHPRFERFQHRAALQSTIGAGRAVSLMQDVAGDLWFGKWSGGASLRSPVRSRFLDLARVALPMSRAQFPLAVHSRVRSSIRKFEAPLPLGLTYSNWIW